MHHIPNNYDTASYLSVCLSSCLSVCLCVCVSVCVYASQIIKGVAILILNMLNGKRFNKLPVTGYSGLIHARK